MTVGTQLLLSLSWLKLCLMMVQDFPNTLSEKYQYHETFFWKKQCYCFWSSLTRINLYLFICHFFFNTWWYCSKWLFLLIDWLVFGCIRSSLLHAGFSLVAAWEGYSLLRWAGFSLWWLLLLWSTGSRHVGFSSCGTQAQQLWLTGSRVQAQ